MRKQGYNKMRFAAKAKRKTSELSTNFPENYIGVNIFKSRKPEREEFVRYVRALKE